MEEIKINGIIWSAHNSNVDKFQNGNVIPEAKTNEQWVKAAKNKKPVWCWSTESPEGNESLGKLYNWYAVTDTRGIAPIGWSVPSEKDLKSLSLNGKTLDKDIDLPKVGLRSYINGTRYSMNSVGYYWSRTEAVGKFAKAMTFSKKDIIISNTDRGNGYSLRFVKGTIPKKVDSRASGGGLTQKTPKTQMSVGASVSLWVLLIFIVFLCLIIMIS